MNDTATVANTTFVTSARAQRKPGAVLVAAAGSLLLVGMAFAQPAKIEPPQKPMDVNNLRPIEPPKAPDATEAGTQAANEAAKSGETSAGEGAPQAAPTAVIAQPEPGQAGAVDGKSYKVTRFVLEWKTPNAQHPTIEEMLAVPVTLAVTPTGYVSPYIIDERGRIVVDLDGKPTERAGATLVTKPIRDLGDGGTATFYSSAVKQIGLAISDELNRRGIIVVLVHPADDQIAMVADPDFEVEKGDDLREGVTDLRLIMRTGTIDAVRTLAGGKRLDGAIAAGEMKRVDPDDKVHNRIRAQSPVNKGDLVRNDLIDDYLFRLNRHPGRRVDLAVAPGSAGDTVALDYTVTENKPWTAYVQISNTGTEATNKWRERFGFVHNQLTGSDDVFRVDYITGGFDQAHAVNVDYVFPLRSDSLKMRVFGGYSQYDAADVGFDDNNFNGESFNAGGELSGTIWQQRDTFLDLVGGVRWQQHEVTSESNSQTGKDDYFAPYVGANLERFRDDSALLVGATVSFNADDLQEDQKDLLGRQQVDASFTVARFNAEYSAYLEPIFNSWGLFAGADGRGLTSLAHEIAVSMRGQWSMDNRLIPTEEDVAGGLFTVRGYPESVAAGDNTLLASLEYRYHVANALRITSVPGKIGETKMPEWFGSNFRWAPQQPFGRADWDLVLKAFVDFASVNSSDKLAGENSDTLVGTGLGAELIYRRNVSLRLDWGVALHHAGQEFSATEAAAAGRDFEVEEGMNEWHFLLTISY
jgi:hemolysin activation/secretion protein